MRWARYLRQPLLHMPSKRLSKLISTGRVNVIPVMGVDTFPLSVPLCKIYGNVSARGSTFLSDHDRGQWWKLLLDAIERDMTKNFVEYPLRFTSVHQQGKPFISQSLAIHSSTGQDEPSLNSPIRMAGGWIECGHICPSLWKSCGVR